MDGKKLIPVVVLGLLLVCTFLIYPMIGQKRATQAETGTSQSVQVSGEEAAQSAKPALKFTWKTAVLGVIAVTAGVLRFRHGRKLREKSWDEFEAGQRQF